MKRVKNYVFLKEDPLGKGTAGTVYKGVNELNGEQVAIKIMEMSSIDNEVTQYLLACEKEALITISNPYVLHALQIVQTQDECLIITPLCNGGTLKQHIKSKGKLSQQEALLIFVKLLRGYLAIKQKGIVHRDIKSSNVMFRNGEPIIIDFGYCEKLHGKKPKMFYNVGSPSYMSPEAYFKTMYSEKSDLWALGIVLYEMVEGYTIDHGQPIDRYFSSLLKHGFVFRSKLSQTIKNLIRSILNPNFNERPPVEYLIQWIERLIFSGKNTFNTQEVKQKNTNNTNNQKLQNNESSPSHKISLKQSQKKNQNLLQQKLAQSKEHYQKTRQQYNKLQNSPKAKQTEVNSQSTPSSKTQGAFDQNLIKLSESVYRPERPPATNTDRSMASNMNATFTQNMQSNKIVQQKFIEQRVQPNNLQAVTQQNFFNTNHQNYRPAPQFVNNGHPVQLLQIPQNVHQSFVVQPEINKKDNQNFLDVNINKLNPQYRSMIEPVAANNRSINFENKNIKVFNSNIFNVESMLTIEPHKEYQAKRQDQQMVQMGKLQKHTSLQEAPLTDSVRSRNDSIQSSINSNVNNSLIVPKQNQVVQSLIFDQNKFMQLEQMGNQVHKSIIVQPISHQNTFFKTQPADFNNPNRPIQNVNNFNFQAQNHANTSGGFVLQQNMPRLSTQQNPNFAQGSRPDQWKNSRPLSPVAAERIPMQTHDRFVRQPLGQNHVQQRNFLKKTEPYFHMNMNEHVQRKQIPHIVNSHWIPEQKQARVQPQVNNIVNQNMQHPQQWWNQGPMHFQMMAHPQQQYQHKHQHQHQAQYHQLTQPIFHQNNMSNFHHAPQSQAQFHQLQHQVMMNRQTLQNMVRNQQQQHHQQRISVMQPRSFPRSNR